MSDLKPCPFCGSRAAIGQLKTGKWPRYTVQCFGKNCIASKSSPFGKYYSAESEAVEAWNRRVGDE